MNNFFILVSFLWLFFLGFLWAGGGAYSEKEYHYYDNKNEHHGAMELTGKVENFFNRYDIEFDEEFLLGYTGLMGVALMVFFSIVIGCLALFLVLLVYLLYRYFRSSEDLADVSSFDSKLLREDMNTAEKKNLKIIYGLYLSGLVLPINYLIGVLICYYHCEDAGGSAVAKSHYRYQIRTFWIGLLLFVISSFSIFFIVGFFLMILWVIWLILRCVKGLSAVNEEKLILNPTTWMF